MRIIVSTVGSYTPDPFKITVLLANNYIPLYANHTGYTENEVRYYKRPSFEKGIIRKPNTLKNIKDALEMAISARRILIGGKNYYFVKGAMYTEEGIPLMVLAMPQKDYIDPNIRKFSELRYGTEVNPVDYKNFVMFYSTSFFTEPSLAPLNRRFQKEILMSCYEKGIEVRVITSSEIEKNTFANIFEIPKVNSVDQLEEYMNKVLPTYLYTEEEDTFVFEELVMPQRVQEELSVEEEALLFDSEASQEEDVIPYSHDESGEFAVEIAEMVREAASWDSAHTESPYLVSMDPASGRNTTVYVNSEGARMFQEALRREVESQALHPAIIHPDPVPTSIVERLGPLQNAYNMQMHTFNNLVITGESVVHSDWANAEATLTQLVGTQQILRDTRPIELIDDTE